MTAADCVYVTSNLNLRAAGVMTKREESVTKFRERERDDVDHLQE
jgi:hypothetical protein